MRIDLSTGTSQPTDPARPVKPDMSRGTGATTSELAPDVANPSADYIRAQALSATLSQLPDVRQERIAALAEMVRGGNYAVTPEQTAEALLSHMADRAGA